jgi:hypothetical protein
MSPSRRRQGPVYPVALACAAILLLASCHGSDKATSSSVPSTNSKGQPVSFALRLGSLTVQAVGRPTPFSRVVANSIRDLMNRYVDYGITRPLFTGSVSPGLAAYFSPSLSSRVGTKGRDHAALTDDGAPVITVVSNAAKQPLALVGLENHGRLVMVSAQFGLSVKGTTAQGPLAVARIGYFVFEPNAKKQWRITGYDIVVRRANGQSSTAQQATTTTAAK